MTTGKDTASFFENGTTYQFEYCFKLYPQVLKMKAEKRGKKPQELVRLDEWYQNELPKLIKERGKDAHMVYDELVQTMKWKQSRGKFYPQLSYLVKVNTPRAVIAETKKAFRKLPNLEQAITALSNLKGVGTTMASALLAAAAPDSAPFMADECLMAIPDIEGIDYTTKEYLNFVQHIQSTVTRLNTEAGGETPTWSPHRVELALWAHYVANDLNPEMLDEMPGPGAGAIVATMNGSAGKSVHEGNEDTNDADGDDESLGATVGRRVESNNTATESETENENTNPAPLAPVSASVLQDGDSNFVSNDSTSQEPHIHDENTTQTTATNSTDDGDVGTPLASDSESNMEAPRKSLATSTVTASDQSVENDTVTVAPVLPSITSTINSGKAPAPPASVAVVAAESTADAAVSANGNGNGTSLSVGDSLDGETSSSNNNCLRRSPLNEEASLDYEEDEEDDDEEHARMADESSNSCSNNSRSGHKSVTPIINLNDGTNNTNNTDDSTLSSAAGIAIGQKRALLHCGADIVGEDANSQPDIKKVRSD